MPLLVVQCMSDETLPGHTLARNLVVARAVTAGNHNAQLRELAGHDHLGMRPGEHEPSAEFMAAMVGWLGNALSARWRRLRWRSARGCTL